MSPLLDVRNLTTCFTVGPTQVPAVRGVSFVVDKGETVGLVGESGCGKSVTALSLMNLVASPPGRIASGRVLLDGRDVLGLRGAELRAVRGGRIAMIFQDPFTSLNPTMTVGDQIAEAIRAHSSLGRREARSRARELLQSVRMPSPEIRMRQYPHQLSGGQRQRVMIAMAFSTDPALLIADEPTTALDVTVQAQILSLMADLRDRTGAAILLITHDLGVVAEICTRVLVMYAGQIVEEGDVASLFGAPKHPYTAGLLRSLPTMTGPRAARLDQIPGQPPTMSELTGGCPFAERCARVMDVCKESEPGRTVVGSGLAVRCHLYDWRLTPSSTAP